MKDTIRGIIKEPGKPARIADIPNTLEGMQALVGGYIETCSTDMGYTFIVNEEGRLLGLKPSGLYDFMGTVLVVGVDYATCEFTDLENRHASEVLALLMPDSFTVRIAPKLYELAYDQLAKPQGITVEQAINRLLAVCLSAGSGKDTHDGQDDGRL